jgi:hypothetical protein
MLWSLQSSILGSAPPAPILFRSSAIVASGTTAAKPAGVAVGDIVVVLAPDGSSTFSLTTSGGSVWTRDATVAVTFTKILNATDVANNWVFDNAPGAGSIAVAWEGRGAAALSLKPTTSVTGPATTSFVVTGFTPSAVSKGVIAFVKGGNVGSPTPPSNFTNRRADFTLLGQTAFADSIGYPGGSLTWTMGDTVIGYGAKLWEVM